MRLCWHILSIEVDHTGLLRIVDTGIQVSWKSFRARLQRGRTMFKINESNIDRAIRFLLGLFLLVVATLLFGIWQWVVGIVAAILIVTGITGMCLFYRLMDINTLQG